MISPRIVEVLTSVQRRMARHVIEVHASGKGELQKLFGCIAFFIRQKIGFLHLCV